MQTLKQIKEDLYLQLKEEVGSSNVGYWTPAEILNALNDTYLFIADETYCFKLSAIIEIRAGKRIYKLPSDYIYSSLYRVEFNEKIIYPTTSVELDARNRNWRNTESNDITHYFLDICASDEIVVFPMPDTDGEVYDTASDSEKHGVIVATGDDSYDEFSRQEGVIVSTVGDAVVEGEEKGVIIDLYNPVNNLQIFCARYPKRLVNDDEVFLHPVTNNPRKILTNGSLAILRSKEGEGKDIQKASYYNKRFMEGMAMFERPTIKRSHRMRSLTDFSMNPSGGSFGGLSLGEHYPAYMR